MEKTNTQQKEDKGLNHNNHDNHNEHENDEETGRWLEEYYQFSETIDLDAEGKEDIRDWPKFKLSNVEFQSKLAAIHHIDNIPLVKNKEERHIVILNDLMSQGAITMTDRSM